MSSIKPPFIAIIASKVRGPLVLPPLSPYLGFFAFIPLLFSIFISLSLSFFFFFFFFFFCLHAILSPKDAAFPVLPDALAVAQYGKFLGISGRLQLQGAYPIEFVLEMLTFFKSSNITSIIFTALSVAWTY